MPKIHISEPNGRNGTVSNQANVIDCAISNGEHGTIQKIRFQWSKGQNDVLDHWVPTGYKQFRNAEPQNFAPVAVDANGRWGIAKEEGIVEPDKNTHNSITQISGLVEALSCARRSGKLTHTVAKSNNCCPTSGIHAFTREACIAAGVAV